MRLKVGLVLFWCSLLIVAQRKGGERPALQPARGMRGAVAGGTEFATEAGLRMYHKGENAVAAGVPTNLAASAGEHPHLGFVGGAPILAPTPDAACHSATARGAVPHRAP